MIASEMDLFGIAFLCFYTYVNKHISNWISEIYGIEYMQVFAHWTLSHTHTHMRFIYSFMLLASCVFLFSSVILSIEKFFYLPFRSTDAFIPHSFYLIYFSFAQRAYNEMCSNSIYTNMKYSNQPRIYYLVQFLCVCVLLHSSCAHCALNSWFLSAKVNNNSYSFQYYIYCSVHCHISFIRGKTSRSFCFFSSLRTIVEKSLVHRLPHINNFSLISFFFSLAGNSSSCILMIILKIHGWDSFQKLLMLQAILKSFKNFPFRVESTAEKRPKTSIMNWIKLKKKIIQPNRRGRLYTNRKKNTEIMLCDPGCFFNY